LTPENVLLSADLTQLVIADFGIASFIEAEMATAIKTKDQSRLASFKYAAPEQLESAAGDKRSDIFALGLMLNEAFTGQLARGSDIAKISGVVPDLAYLDDVVDLMIRQKLDSRIQSMVKVKDEIAARSQLAITRQKIDAISKEVVPETELDDPLIRTPPNLAVEDWKQGRLFLRLSLDVNQLWRTAFTDRGYEGMYQDSSPDRASWHNEHLFSVVADARLAPQVFNNYSRHTERTNRVYAQEARQAHETNLRRLREELEKKAKQEAERFRVLESLRRA
jgi:serine/threonine protein kinase